MFISKSKTYVIFLLVFGIASCIKEPNFSLTPEVTFKKIDTETRLDQSSGGVIDSVTVSIGFKDGDGDLGWNQSDIGKLVDSTDFNFVIKDFRKINGSFVPNTINNLSSSGFFFKLDEGIEPGSIEGTLNHKIIVFSSFVPPNDTIRFEIYIKDRAGNRSNTIQTSPIVINTFKP